jgi:hypothetical protein
MGKANGKKMIKIKNQINILVIMLWTKNMDKDSLTGKVEIIILENIKMILDMDMGKCIGLMALFIREIGNKVYSMDSDKLLC